MNNVNHNTISWSQFEQCNANPQEAFENMCRLLFNRTFFDNKAILHSNPNNPGVEVEPIIEPSSNKKISFQSKYINSSDYNQIKKSARTTVKYYSDNLDIVYLYCNKDLTTTSQSYQDIQKILNDAGIQLVLISNQSILNQIVNYPILTSLYFRNHRLTIEWFKKHMQNSIESLGKRYNSRFNVETQTEMYVNLFSHNDNAIKYINERLEDSLTFIKKLQWPPEYNKIKLEIIDEVLSFEYVDEKNILHCLEFYEIIKYKFSNIWGTLENKMKTLEEQKREYIQSNNKDYKNIQDIEAHIRQIEKILTIPEQFKFDDIKDVLQNKILIVDGEAGTGKSQIFAHVAKSSIDLDIPALLLLGQLFLSAEPLDKQLSASLNISADINLDEILEILEGLGEVYDKCIVIYIDAINESSIKKIWLTGLNPIVNKICELNHVRLALSVREGYENLVFDDAIKTKTSSNTITKITHRGFRNESIEATKAFLDNYGIPFSPPYFLQYDMSNPLFLTFFCETYSGEDVDLFTLFERVIDKVDNDIKNTINLDCTSNILRELVYNVAAIMIEHGIQIINQEAILQCKFWDIYGLSSQKLQILAAAERSGVLMSYAYDDQETYGFGYNLFENFACAKLIMKKFSDNSSLKLYLRNDLLKIYDGQVHNHSNIDTFLVICSLYAEKYQEECIDIIDDLNKNWQIQSIVSKYIQSFYWRKANTINRNFLFNYTKKHRIPRDEIINLFIVNSMKPNHPLNAEYLHEILLKMPINRRDYVWTIHINGLTWEEERIYQMITYLFEGNSLKAMSSDHAELMLILFTWLLTSSNRKLRDLASKAMIEILKYNFKLCMYILVKFENINDPYVFQRLYGIVLGACMKRVKSFETEFKDIAEYTYDRVFNQETVYPDILLRDYARLIVERFIYEYPQDNSTINTRKIKPPYSSKPIPKVKVVNYRELDNPQKGLREIACSLSPNYQGMPYSYGDFGRYVFQSALDDFENIDIPNLYYYAMDFIQENLGYDDKLFAEYDMRHSYGDRYTSRKTERIGKKYQWIAFYNILARVSDSHMLKQWDDSIVHYKGPWEPYVRDFDPTLNINFLSDTHMPDIPSANINHNDFIDPSRTDIAEIKSWLNIEPLLYDLHSQKLMMEDSGGQKWISLSQHESYNYNKDDNNSLLDDGRNRQTIWSMSFGYFVKEKDFREFKNNLKGKNFMGRWMPEGGQYYQLFTREVAWSPSINDLLSESWVDCVIDTDETVTENVESEFLAISLIGFDNETIEVGNSANTYTKYLKKRLGKVLPATIDILWEEEFDASIDESVIIRMSCKDIIEFLHLEQKKYDGFFYSETGDLVCFDSTSSLGYGGVLIRKDYLDKFLDENQLRLFWTCLGEKQYFMGSVMNQQWSEWSGFFYLEKDRIIGNMEIKKVQ